MTTSAVDPGDLEPDHPANAPFSGIVALAALLLLCFGGYKIATGGGGNQPHAEAATVAMADTPQKARATQPEKEVAAPGRDVPLRPPPNDACADNTNNWCGERISMAAVIVDVGIRETKLPRRGWIVAVATAMQEGALDNLATEKYPVTKQFPYKRLGADHDSVGLFQQRPSQGWGTPEELMDPRIAAKKFYDSLAKKVKNWDGWENPKRVRLTDIAQRVQKSGYPEAYQKHEALATKIVNIVLKYQYTSEFHNKDVHNKWFVMFQCKRPKSKDCRMVPWELIEPVKNNRDVFDKHFPNAGLNGHIGDWHHQNAETPQDHTSAAASCYGNSCNRHGWVYAQDFGNGKGSGFDCNHFVRWLLDELRAHPDKYKEVKYVISRSPDNKGTSYYGLLHRKNGWKPADADGHTDHVHISFMPGFERANSTIMADYVASLNGGANKPVAAPVSGAAAGFPLF